MDHSNMDTYVIAIDRKKFTMCSEMSSIKVIQGKGSLLKIYFNVYFKHVPTA